MLFKTIIETTEFDTIEEYFKHLSDNGIALSIEEVPYGLNFISFFREDERNIGGEKTAYLYDKSNNYIRLSIPYFCKYEEEVKSVIFFKIKEMKKETRK